MTLTELTHDAPNSVADYLETANSVTHEEIVAATINALRRIAALEKELNEQP